MGNALKKLKKGKANSSPLNPQLMAAWRRGFEQGASSQRESDIESTIKFLETLEEIPGIGEKTAWKIREMFLSRFGK